MMTKTRKIRSLIFGLMAVLSVWGCERRAGSELMDVPAPGTVRVGYTIDGLMETRSTPVLGHERTLVDVHILFYTEEGSYVTYQHANVTSGTSSFTFPIPAVLTPNTPYKTLVLGNSHDHVPSGFASFDAYLEQSSTMSYDEMYEQVYAERNMDHSSGSTHSGSLPMWGQFVDGDGHEIAFQFTEQSDGRVEFTGSAHFSRSVCRLDLRHLAAQNLIIDAVKLCNYRSAGYYFHNDAPKGGIVDGLSDQSWISVSAPTQNVQELNGGVYAFPNIVPVVVQNDLQTTYLMIRGYYQDGTDNTPENPKKKLTYYRFNMAENGRSQILRRNYRYLAIINSVKGPGSDDEQGAHDEEAPMLDYTVDDSWTDDDGNTVTDDKGNYLTISRAMVTFDGYKDLSEAVKVVVKDGLTWSVEWDPTLVGEESSKFRYARVDDRQFSVTTLEDNATDFSRNARLIVKASGGTVDPQKPLTATVSVMQFSSKDEMATLMVDGQTGTVEQTVAGSGATLRFQVETGSLKSGWSVTDPNNTAATAGVTWTLKGANRGVLEVDVPTNITAGERAFTLKVQRLGSDGQVDGSVNPVMIQITQPKSDYLLSINPSEPQDQEGLVVEGFDPEPNVRPNGVSAQRKFTVQLADPDNYTWKVESSFAKDYDLFLTKTDPAAVTTQAVWKNNSTVNSITGLKNGESIWINVFRTGPGDPTFSGTLTFTAVPNGEGETQSINVTVTVKTSCTINDVIIQDAQKRDYILVADRNVGADPRIQDGKFVTAGNYHFQPEMHITGKAYSEITYTQWKGTETYNSSKTITEALDEMFTDVGTGTNADDAAEFSPWYKTADKAKWGYSFNAAQANITYYIGLAVHGVMSKGRLFFISQYWDLNAGKGTYVGCYFPMTTSNAYYATQLNATMVASQHIRFYSLPPSIASTSLGAPIRLMRTLTQAEITEAGYIPIE